MSKNTWRLLVGIIGIGLVVFVTLVFLSPKTDNGVTPVSEQAGDRVQKTPEQMKAEVFETDKSILVNAVTKGDIEACGTIQNEILQASCTETATMIKAKDDQNPALCASLTDEDIRKKCQEKAGAKTVQ